MSYTIGALARAADVPNSTVLYYERRGLLLPEGRTQARYRSYGSAALERLRFIRAHQRSGLTLDNIGQILKLTEGGCAPRESVQRMLTQRLAEIDQTLRELRRTRPVLRACLQTCERAGSVTVACPALVVSRRKYRGRRA